MGIFGYCNFEQFSIILEFRFLELFVTKPVEMKKLLGELSIKKYYRPPWLADKENFSFQIV